MNYGRFFNLDTNSSQLVRGLTVFNYRGIKNSGELGKLEGNNTRTKYPIYVNFSREGVSFNLHFVKYSEDNDCNDKKIKPKTDREIIGHSNSLILSLPISTNRDIRDNLTRNICEIFKNNFTKPNEKDSICELVKARWISSEDSLNLMGITYSSLEVFDINYGNKEYAIAAFLRKLLLDFIYDLEHTDIFKNAPYYEIVYEALNSNFLFRSIRNKAEYYYQRKMASITGVDNARLDGFARDIFIADNFIEAEKRWVETIADPRAESIFHFSNGWLGSVEEEMNAVYQSARLSKIASNDKEELKEKIVKSKGMTWRCADFVSNIRCSKQEDEDGKLAYNKKCLSRYNKKIIINARIALHWYLQKYNFAGILVIWNGGRHSTWRLVLRFFLALLFLSIIAIELTPCDWVINLHVPILIALGLLAVRFIFYCKDRKMLGNVGGVNVYLPRLLAAVITAWLTLVIGENIFKGFFDRLHSWGTSSLLILATLLFVYHEIDKLNHYLRITKKIARAVVFVAIAFIYSVLSGIIVMDFFGIPYLERTDSIEKFYTHNIYIDKPKYEIKECVPYVHQHFYETIEYYDKELLNLIQFSDLDLEIEGMREREWVYSKLQWCDKNIATFDNFLGSTHLSSICNMMHRINKDIIVNSAPKVREYRELMRYLQYADLELTDLKFNSTRYIVTIKLLAEFAARKNYRLVELHRNMVYGSLIDTRFDNLKSYLASVEKDGSKNITLTLKNLDDLNIKFNKVTGEVEDQSWICLLNAISTNSLYSKTLACLTPAEHMHDDKGKILDKAIAGTDVFRNMLFQFSIIAMFIGVFLQLIFTDKSVTEPI